MSVRQTVVTANVGRGVTQAEAERNILAIHRGFKRAVIGWQEIDEADVADEHSILREVFDTEDYRNVGFGHATPITLPAPWTVVPGTADVTQACQWLAKATPNRFIVSALCQHPDLREPVVFENGHYPLARLGGREGAGRWNDTHAAWVKRTKEWRREGYTIITTRDTNRLKRMPKLHWTERQLLPNAISRITVVPGSVSVAPLGTRDVKLTIDGHNARGVKLELSDKKRKVR